MAYGIQRQPTLVSGELARSIARLFNGSRYDVAPTIVWCCV
jgi:hypothetical protein